MTLNYLLNDRFLNKSCSETEVEKWLRRRRSGEEKRCLITDDQVSRGWEASHAMVVDLFGNAIENLVMRTIGFCTLVKQAEDSSGGL